MDLALTESQEMLKGIARSFMAREASKDTIVALEDAPDGRIPDAWRKAADLGWLGMLIPSEHGGSDASFCDTAVLYEELGRGPMPGPFFSSGVLGALLLLEGGTEAQRRALLPAIARGERIVTLAVSDPGTSWGPQAVTMTPQRANGSATLTGTKLFVSDATSATDLIVAVRTGEAPTDVSLALVDVRAPGVTTRRLPGFLSWQGEVTFERVAIDDAAILGGAPSRGWAMLEQALYRAWPILCSYMVGGCQAVYEMSVSHSRTRVQFGVPIGKFQRVQDHIVELVNHLDAARWTTAEALWKLDTGRDAAAGIHLAKAVASEGYLQACNAAHEVHAGIGSANEYGLVAHTQMSRTLFHHLGDPRWHKRRMADALGW